MEQVRRRALQAEIDEEHTRIRRLLELFIGATAALCLIHSSVIWAVPEMRPHLWKNAVAMTILLLMHLLLRTGRVRLTAHLLVALLWLLVNYVAFAAGGVERPAFAWNIPLLLVAALTLGSPVSFAYGVLTLAAGIGMAILRVTGRLEFSSETRNPIDGASAQLLGVVVAAVFIGIAAGMLRRSLASLRAGRVELTLQNRALGAEITARRAAEQALRSANVAAEAANVAKDQFLAMLSHELRTPLTPVLLSVSQLASSSLVPDDLRAELATVQRHVEMEARLIDDLLDLSRITSGKLSLHTRPCDLHAAVEATVGVCREDIEQKRISIELNLGAAACYVQGDVGRLQQVFWNLLRNAIRATPEGGCIRFRSRNLTSNPDPTIVVEVTDNGAGIDPLRLESIFTMFQQSGPLSRQAGGLGIGLSICRALVEAHHGSVIAHSPGLGQGATFSVLLPTTAARPALVAMHPTDGESASHSLRILLVEDHEATAHLLAKLLRRLGHHVQVAHTVARALELAAANTLDLLVSDIGLPDGNGVDLLIQLRQTCPIPAIALSGFGMEQDLQRSREAGFLEHIVKPVDFARLRQAITRVGAGAKQLPVDAASATVLA